MPYKEQSSSFEVAHQDDPNLIFEVKLADGDDGTLHLSVQVGAQKICKWLPELPELLYHIADAVLEGHQALHLHSDVMHDLEEL